MKTYKVYFKASVCSQIVQSSYYVKAFNRLTLRIFLALFGPDEIQKIEEVDANDVQ